MDGATGRCNTLVLREESPVFLVLDPYSIPLPGADWADHGWYILINGKQQWVYEGDIEDDSDLLEDT
jgi:hypothetical protein